MSEKPQISVIIGAYNVEEYIGDTIKSVINQTYTNFELIIVDDASTDRTGQIAKDYSNIDDRIRCVTMQKNSGCPAPPRNKGISEARSGLVAFLDADDLWKKHKLEDQLSVMKAYPDFALVYSMAQYTGNVSLENKFNVIPMPKQAALNQKDLEDNNPITASSVMARTALIKELGGFDEDPRMKAIEDYDLWFRISSAGKIAFIPRLHVLYRVHRAGISKKINAVETANYFKSKRNVSGNAGLKWHESTKKEQKKWRKPFINFKKASLITCSLFTLMVYRIAEMYERHLKKSISIYSILNSFEKRKGTINNNKVIHRVKSSLFGDL